MKIQALGQVNRIDVAQCRDGVDQHHDTHHRNSPIVVKIRADQRGGHPGEQEQANPNRQTQPESRIGRFGFIFMVNQSRPMPNPSRASRKLVTMNA